jgi:hypothetical protein
MADSDSIPGAGRRKTNPSDLQLARVAARQFGVVSLAQLEALGLSYEQVRRRVEGGRLHRLHRDVFAVGHTSLGTQARLVAALLTGGPGAFLSHRTAAAARGLRELSAKSIEVTMVGSSSRARPGLRIHRTRYQPAAEDLAVRNGLRVSSVPRLLIELALRERPAGLDQLITQAVRKRVFDPAAVELGLRRPVRHPGIAKLKAALADYLPRPDRASDLERAFDALIAGTDIAPPLRNIRIDGWEIDCYWPRSRLAVELDGRPYDVAVGDLEKDRIKDAKLLRQGIMVLRITDRRLSLDPRGVLDDVRALVA